MFKCYTRPEKGGDSESLIRRKYDCYEISDAEAKEIVEEKAAKKVTEPTRVRTVDGKTYIWMEEHEEGRKIAIAPINILGHWSKRNTAIKNAIISAIAPKVNLQQEGTFMDTLSVNCSYMNWYACSWYPSFSKITKEAQCQRFNDFVSADNANPTALIGPLRFWQFPFAKWVISRHIREYYEPKSIIMHEYKELDAKVQR